MNESGRLTAEKFAAAAAAAGLLSYKPGRHTASGTGGGHRRTSSVIQALLVESVGNSEQRFGVLGSAWAQCRAGVEAGLAAAHTHATSTCT